MSINFIILVTGERDISNIQNELMSFCSSELSDDAKTKGLSGQVGIKNALQIIQMRHQTGSTYFAQVTFMNYEYESPNLHCIFYPPLAEGGDLITRGYIEYFGGICEKVSENDEAQHFVLRDYNKPYFNEVFTKNQHRAFRSETH